MKYHLILAFCLSMFSISAHSKTLVIIGDSLTEGYGVSKEAAFPALLEKKIKDSGKEWTIVNSGISGSTTASAPSRVKWVLKSKPDLVMIALGANDGLRGLKVSSSKKNLEQAMDILKKEKIPFIIGGLYMPPNFGKNYSKQFNDMYKDLSKKYDAKLIPFILENVAGNTKLNLADGVHPNEAGHKIMADTVYNQIKELLK